MTGGANFNEVFLTEVRVPDDDRLGDVNAGWQVALTTLMNERATIGKGGGGGVDKLVQRLPEMVRHFGLDTDPIVRNRVADVLLRFRVAELTNRRGLAQIERGRNPGPEMSIGKLASAINSSLFVNLVCEILGPKLAADTGEWGTYAWTQTLLGDAASHIAGGTDQVMRNILGERVLGLPKEPGIDTTSPFKDLPQSAGR
jgi:acyl-CoA dehydrogenase